MTQTSTPTDIYIQADKNGKPIAHRHCRKAQRNIRISLDKAYLMIATGEGRLVNGKL